MLEELALNFEAVVSEPPSSFFSFLAESADHLSGNDVPYEEARPAAREPKSLARAREVAAEAEEDEDELDEAITPFVVSPAAMRARRAAAVEAARPRAIVLKLGVGRRGEGQLEGGKREDKLLPKSKLWREDGSRERKK